MNNQRNNYSNRNSDYNRKEEFYRYNSKEDIIKFCVIMALLIIFVGAFFVMSALKISCPPWIGVVIGYITLTCIVVGCYIGYRKVRVKVRRKYLKECVIIEGIIIGHSLGDYIGSSHKSKYHYPIYEYYLNGHKETLYSNVGQGRANRDIGDMVKIVYNPATNDVFCLEDEKSKSSIYRTFIMIGIFFLIILTCSQLGLFS